jgi:hypothetical protein
MLRWIFWLLLLILPTLAAHAYQGDYVWEEKFKEALPLANSGNTEAQYDVGEMYERGRGVNRNMKQAFHWYLKAAEQGNTKGAFRTGLCYLKGEGVAKNLEKALKWFQKSAEKSYERANYYLGVMYEKGEGVPVNLTRALTYYKKAYSSGYAPAHERIADVKMAIAEEARLRAERAEAEARKQLARQREARSRIRSVSRKPPLTTKEVLLKGGWNKRNRPAEFLPSKITNCRETGINIECMSNEVKRNVGSADITYKTKAVIYSIDDGGSFKISYRNNVTKVKALDTSSGVKIPVKKGWQDADHILECEMQSNELVSCTKDKIRKLNFTRK